MGSSCKGAPYGILCVTNMINDMTNNSSILSHVSKPIRAVIRYDLHDIMITKHGMV